MKTEETKDPVEEEAQAAEKNILPFQEKPVKNENEIEPKGPNKPRSMSSCCPLRKRSSIVSLDKEEKEPVAHEEPQTMELLEALDDDLFLEKYSGRGHCHPLETFPFLYSFVPHPVANQIYQIIRNNEQFNPSCSADHSFAWFLYHLSKKANSLFYNQVLNAVLIFRECINKHGHGVLSQFSEETRNSAILSNLRRWLGPAHPQVKLTALISAEYIFVCGEFFLVHYLPKHYSSQFSREFALDFVLMMNKWMVDKSLSKISLMIR